MGDFDEEDFGSQEVMDSPSELISDGASFLG